MMARARFRLPDALSDHDLQRLMAAARQAGAREHAAIALMAYAGLRVSEVAKLRWDDIEGTVIRVRMGKGRKDRLVPAHPIVQEALSGLRKTALLRSPWTFPSPQDPRRPITTRALQYMVERLGQQADIPRRLAHPHTLRHTFATRTLRQSGNLEVVRRLLGHASVSTTQIYVHLVVDDLARVVEKLD